MERNYGNDRERSVNKGPGWDKFRNYMDSHNPGLNVDYILEKIHLKRDPVISYGIIEFSIKRGKHGLCAYYHVFRRRYTMEYDMLLRGYAKKNQLFDLISLLSRDEKDRILKHTWEELWDDYWIDHSSKGYTSLKAQSQRRFEELKEILTEIDSDIPSRITERPYIFPKGKPDKNETGWEAALREAKEETCSNYEKGYLYFNSPIIQHYNGSDGCPYTDYYYVWYRDDVHACPTRKLFNVHYLPRSDQSIPSLPSSPPGDTISTSSDSETMDPSTKALILQLMPEMKTLEGFQDMDEAPEPDSHPWTYVVTHQTPRLRNVTISHELESDAWIEIPIFDTVKERMEWMNSINPFKEFGIFKRHFSAIMEIHSHLP